MTAPQEDKFAAGSSFSLQRLAFEDSQTTDERARKRGKLAVELPLMLRTNGLVATIAFLAAGKDAEKWMLERLLKAGDVPETCFKSGSNTDFPKLIECLMAKRGLDVAAYVGYQKKMMIYADWLKKFCAVVDSGVEK